MLRRGKTIAAGCGHMHRNRDFGTRNARDCIAGIVRAAHPAEDRSGYLYRDLQQRALHGAETARCLGARITDAEAIERLTATYEAVRALLPGATVLGREGSVYADPAGIHPRWGRP